MSFLESPRHKSFAKGLEHAHDLLRNKTNVTVLWLSNIGCEYLRSARDSFQRQHPDVNFRVFYRTRNVPQANAAIQRALGKIPTTGFAVIHVLVEIGWCASVSLFGFQDAPNASCHYWSWADDRAGPRPRYRAVRVSSSDDVAPTSAETRPPFDAR